MAFKKPFKKSPFDTVNKILNILFECHNSCQAAFIACLPQKELNTGALGRAGGVRKHKK